jgi:hypothetical protein
MSLLQSVKNWLQKRVATLPTIPTAALSATISDDDYLFVLVEAYEQLASPDIPLAKLDSFTNEAAVLLLFSTLKGQVENGGFIQLIQNGYGPALFESPFIQDIAGWGATQLAELAEQAKSLYLANKAYLERPRAIPEFSALYKEFRAFEPLETHFYSIIDSQTASVRAYVEQHLPQFARLA